MLFERKENLTLKIAFVISRLSEPFLLLTILGVIILFSHYLAGYNRWEWGLGLVLFLGVLPLGTLWLGVKKVKKIDIDFTKKENRTPFILVILFYWTVGLILSWSLSGPKIILVLLIISIISNILVLLINFFWKVSNHLLGVSVFSLFIIQLFGWQYWWWLLLCPAVGWSRWVQKKHTLGQLIGGAGLGLSAWMMLIMLGY